MKKRCSATTKLGKACRAWAIRGGELCSAHARANVGAGAPKGNGNAVKHGFYRSVLTADEVADLVTHAENDTIDDEIALTRVLLRRLMKRLQEPDVDLGELRAVSPLIFTGARTVASLMRQKKPSGGIQDTINDILDELSSQYPIQL